MRRDNAERNHVDHGGVAGDEQQEGDLHGVGLVEVPREDLLGGEGGEDVVLGGFEAFVEEGGEVF